MTMKATLIISVYTCRIFEGNTAQFKTTNRAGH